MGFKPLTVICIKASEANTLVGNAVAVAKCIFQSGRRRFCFSFRHGGRIAAFAILTMSVGGGSLLGSIVFMGLFVNEKTDALKNDSSRLHQWLFQWRRHCIHIEAFTH